MILCLGTTPTVQRTMTFDRVTIDAVNRAVDVRETASGKGVNVARVLHTIGERPLASGFVGGDTGTLIRADLDEAGIAHDFVTVGPRTRTCVTVINRADNTATELVEEPRRVEAGAWDALLEKIEGCVPRLTAAVLSGSLVPGGPEDFYARCVRMLRPANVPVILDARGRALELALPERPFLVKPNRSELAATVDTPLDSDEAIRGAIRRLIGMGARWAVVTMGGDGAVASDGQQFWRAAPPKVPVVSPIGSGDAMAAGIIAGILRGQSVPDACRLGTACAVANAMVPISGHLRREDVDRLWPLVSVTPM